MMTGMRTKDMKCTPALMERHQEGQPGTRAWSPRDTTQRTHACTHNTPIKSGPAERPHWAALLQNCVGFEEGTPCQEVQLSLCKWGPFWHQVLDGSRLPVFSARMTHGCYQRTPQLRAKAFDSQNVEDTWSLKKGKERGDPQLGSPSRGLKDRTGRDVLPEGIRSDSPCSLEPSRFSLGKSRLEGRWNGARWCSWSNFRFSYLIESQEKMIPKYLYYWLNGQPLCLSLVYKQWLYVFSLFPTSST